LEDIADNIFHADPYYQGGGDMVRIGGMGYAIDVSKPMGSRISEMTHLKTGRPIDPAQIYPLAGGASTKEKTQGPPIWDVVASHISKTGTVAVLPNSAVRVTGA